MRDHLEYDYGCMTRGDPRLQMAESKKRQLKIEPETLERIRQGKEPLEDLIQLSDDDKDRIRERALALAAAGQHEKGRAVLEMLIALGDLDPRSQIGLAMCLSELGDRARARAHLQSGLAMCQILKADELLQAAQAWGRTLLAEAPDEEPPPVKPSDTPSNK